MRLSPLPQPIPKYRYNFYQERIQIFVVKIYSHLGWIKEHLFLRKRWAAARRKRQIEREREIWNSIRKGGLSRMTRLSIRVGGRQRISHASSFHFIPRTSSGAQASAHSRPTSPLPLLCLASEGWFRVVRAWPSKEARYPDTRRYFPRFPWKTM